VLLLSLVQGLKKRDLLSFLACFFLARIQVWATDFGYNPILKASSSVRPIQLVNF
jgi:hypothetical protein